MVQHSAIDHSGLLGLSYGSNATRLRKFSGAGSSNALARADHFHDGIAEIISNGSNTLSRGALNLRMGTVTWGLDDSDGDGVFDRMTLNASGGGASVASAFSGAAAYNSGNFAVNVGGETVVTMDTDLFDTDAYHDTSSNTGRMTCPSGKDGYFSFTVTARLSGNQQGYVVVRKTKVSGGGGSASGIVGLGSFTWDTNAGQGEVNFSGIIDLKATDYLELKATTGSAVNITTGTQPWFAIARLGS